DQGKQERLGAALAHRVRRLAGLLLRAEEGEALAEERLPIEPGDPLAERDDVAHDDDGRILEPAGSRHLRDLSERRYGDALLGARPPVNDGDGSTRRTTTCQNGARDLLDAAHAHEHADRVRRGAELLPGLGRPFHAGAITARDERDAAREVAMRERDPRVRARRDGRRNARHDLEGNAGRSERERFLPAASEHQWVAALEAHHALARPAERDELLIDGVLR